MPSHPWSFSERLPSHPQRPSLTHTHSHASALAIRILTLTLDLTLLCCAIVRRSFCEPCGHILSRSTDETGALKLRFLVQIIYIRTSHANNHSSRRHRHHIHRVIGLRQQAACRLVPDFYRRSLVDIETQPSNIHQKPRIPLPIHTTARPHDNLQSSFLWRIEALETAEYSNHC